MPIQLDRKLLFTHLIIYVLIFLCVGCGKDDNDELSPKNTTTQDETGRDNGNDNTSGDAEEKIDGPNLLTNGNLEKWGATMWGLGNWPSGWSLPSNDYINKDESVVFEGVYSAKLQSLEKGVTARVEQKIQVNPQSKIRIIFHYFISQWKSNGARTYCYFRTASAEKYNISTDVLQSFYGEKTYRIIRGGGYGLTYFPAQLNTWQVFDETIEVPPTATYFVFGVNSYYGTTIYVDDCYVMSDNPNVEEGITE